MLRKGACPALYNAGAEISGIATPIPLFVLKFLLCFAAQVSQQCKRNNLRKREDSRALSLMSTPADERYSSEMLRLSRQKTLRKKRGLMLLSPNNVT
jgi:hypothetical protein